MAGQKSITKTLCSLTIFAILSLQSANAQNCTYDNNYVPPFGIAIIVLTALLLLASLCSCGILPIMCKKGGGDGCQGGSGCGCCGK